MNKSIDTIWREHAARQLGSELPDLELNAHTEELKELLEGVSASSAQGEWQRHYDIALSVCRVSRRMRFRLAELQPDADTHAKIITLLSQAYNEIQSDEQANSIHYSVKTLNDIRGNIQNRLTSIEKESQML